jgi:hypothetical protein
MTNHGCMIRPTLFRRALLGVFGVVLLAGCNAGGDGKSAADCFNDGSRYFDDGQYELAATSFDEVKP